jgi:hypothetical protein
VQTALLSLVITLVSATGRAGPLQPRDYIERDFLARLQATRSPILALQYGWTRQIWDVPQSIRVSSTGEGMEFDAHLNWHEGYRMFTLRPDGGMERGEERMDYPQPAILSDHSFHLLDPRSKDSGHTYVFVGDADQAISNIALCGTYAGENGKTVVFGPQGLLHGLGSDSAFTLNNDHVLGPEFDYFTSGSGLTAFRHQGRNLKLYPIVGPPDPASGIGRADFAHPIMALRWVSGCPAQH